MSDSIYTLRGRLDAHAVHSKHDSHELTAAARAKFLERFINEVNPARALPEAERLKQAEHALRAHMTRLAIASARARRKRATS